MFSLQLIDYVMLGVIALSMLTGLFRGFLKELTTLCVWGLAIWLGLSYAQQLTPWLSPYIHDRMLRTVIGFLIIFFAVILLGALVNLLVSFMVHRSGLSSTDRLLGVMFGFIRGLLLVCLLMLAADKTGFDKAYYTHQSVFYPHLLPFVHWLSGAVKVIMPFA